MFKRVNYKLSNSTFWVVINLVDMNDYRLWAQGSRCSETLRVADNKNDWRSCKLKPLDFMYHLGWWMILMILHRELKPLNAMNSLGLWMTWTTPGHELRALDAMNSSRLWLTWMTPCREPRALNAMNNLRLRMALTTLGHLLKPLDMKDFGLWA